MHIKLARRISKIYWKNLLKINILQLTLGEFFKKKGAKNGAGEETKMQCNFSSILVHFGCPFGVSFGPKMVQKRGPKTSAKMRPVLVDFETLLGPFWRPFGPCFGPFEASWGHFDPPKWHLDAPSFVQKRASEALVSI